MVLPELPRTSIESSHERGGWTDIETPYLKLDLTQAAAREMHGPAEFEDGIDPANTNAKTKQGATLRMPSFERVARQRDKRIESSILHALALPIEDFRAAA